MRHVESMTQIGLGALAVIFAGVAAVGCGAPNWLFDPIGVSMAEPAGWAEIRAAYGGLFFGTAFIAGLGAVRREVRSTALVLVNGVLWGFVLGRLVSLGVDGWPNSIALGNLALETAGGCVATTLMALRWRLSSDTSEGR